MKYSNALRFVCVEFRFEGRRNPNVDLDFVHIRGDVRARLHTVNMWRCSRVTDAAFVHLRGIQSLNMVYCDQTTITDTAFVHLRGIQTLNINQGFRPAIKARSSSALLAMDLI